MDFGTSEQHELIRPSTSPLFAYLSLYFLLLTVTVSELFFSGIGRMLSDLISYSINKRLFGTAIYTVFAMTLLGIGYLLYRNIRGVESNITRDDSARLVLAICLLLSGSIYAVLGTVSTPGPKALLLGTFLMSLIGLGVPAIVYLQVNNTDLQLNFDIQSAIPIVVITCLLSALVPLVLSVVAPTSSENQIYLMFGRQYIHPASFSQFIQNSLIQSIFLAFGTSILFHGAIQETLAKYTTPAGAIAATIALFGSFRYVTKQSFVYFDGLNQLFSALLLPVVGSALVVAFTFFAIFLWQIVGLVAKSDEIEAVSAAVFGIAIVALLMGSMGAILGPIDPHFVGYTIGHTAVIGLAAVSYDRTSSVWSPMFTIAIYLIAAGLLVFL